jgi:hypothetical protein
MSSKRDALRQQQAAADGAFAARLVLACAALALTLWVSLPSCDQKEHGEPSLLGRALAGAPPAPPAPFSGKVPRTIHQVAASKQLPEVFEALQASGGGGSRAARAVIARGARARERVCQKLKGGRRPSPVAAPRRAPGSTTTTAGTTAFGPTTRWRSW